LSEHDFLLLHNHSKFEGQSRVSDHGRLAGLIFFIGFGPTLFYFAAFKEFNGSNIPWKLSLDMQIIIPLILILHFFENRKKSRMWHEGCAAAISLLEIWMLIGSYPFIYFSFAPIPLFIKIIGLTSIITGTTHWIYIAWHEYLKFDKSKNLENELFIDEGERILYYGTQADLIIASMPQRNPFTRIHFLLVSACGPFLGGVCLILFKLIPASFGLNFLFLFLSFICFPLSQWLLGYLVTRTVYFHIYLPLKIEHKTGKIVILGP
jgi:hypothetical protein